MGASHAHSIANLGGCDAVVDCVQPESSNEGWELFTCSTTRFTTTDVSSCHLAAARLTASRTATASTPAARRARQNI
jgi:hypothetical protein